MWFRFMCCAIAALCVTRWSEQKQGLFDAGFHRGYANTGRALSCAHSGMSGPNAAMRRYLQAVSIRNGRGMWA